MTKIKSFIKSYYGAISLSVAFIVAMIADNLFIAVLILGIAVFLLYLMVYVHHDLMRYLNNKINELIDKEK